MGYCGQNCGVSYHPCANYTCGDSGAKVDYSVNADSHGYTSRFYSLSQHEIFSEFRYDKVSRDYDSNTKEIVESLRGPSIEEYIPRSLVVDGGGSAVPANKSLVDVPKKRVIEEIEKAQREVTKQTEIVLREVQIEELLLRRVRTRTVVLKKNAHKRNGQA